MKRFFPHPVLAAFLLAMWLLLNQSPAPGQILLGGVIAIAASAAMSALRPEKVRIRSLRPIPRFAMDVLHDVVRSNIAVGRIICGSSSPDRVSGFVSLPLDLRNTYGLAVLACVISATPGTLWVQFDRQRNKLIVHVLDLIDEDEWVRLIKQRYEKPLMDIFE
jgi:multicomponent K+:H+ antiporter subunit E